MRCVYCSAVIERNAWFCPYCKRSVCSRHGGHVKRATLRRTVMLMFVLAAAVGGLTAWMSRLVSPAHLVFAPAAGAPGPALLPPLHAALPTGMGPGRAMGAVTVWTVPPVKTFVYLNGGSLLGEAPLRNVPIPAGKQNLVFWAPTIGGRSVRTVQIEPGGSALVIEHVSSQGSFRPR